MIQEVKYILLKVLDDQNIKYEIINLKKKTFKIC